MQAIFCLGCFSAIGVLCGFLAIDRLGRRRVLLFSGVGTCLSLFLLSLSFLLADVNSPPVVDGCAQARERREAPALPPRRSPPPSALRARRPPGAPPAAPRPAPRL